MEEEEEEDKPMRWRDWGGSNRLGIPPSCHCNSHPPPSQYVTAGNDTRVAIHGGGERGLAGHGARLVLHDGS